MKVVQCVHQSIYVFKIVVVGNPSPHMLPDILLRIQFRRVRWQPLNLNALFMFAQELLHDLRLMRLVVVSKDDYAAFWMR